MYGDSSYGGASYGGASSTTASTGNIKGYGKPSSGPKFGAKTDAA